MIDAGILYQVIGLSFLFVVQLPFKDQYPSPHPSAVACLALHPTWDSVFEI